MAAYWIKRTDQGGGYVASTGSKSSYTPNPKYARTYPSREAAERDRCVENEVVVNAYQEMGL